MIKKITLTNFMQHENFSADFTNGLQVIKGASEAGKSTLLLAAAYALYGTKVLAESLSEVVTWGKAEKDLRVELALEVDGKLYTFTRSKGGAEVVQNGQVFVTGQNEVSAFATNLLGADHATAAILMFANQGSLRGTLDAGPKATAQVIEQLADFDLFDRLLEAASEKLSLGAPTLFEERLKGQRAQLEMLAMPEQPDEAAFQQAVLGYDVRLTMIEAAHTSAKAEYDTTYAKWKAEYDRRWARGEIEQSIAKYQEQQDATREKLHAERHLSMPDTSLLKQEIETYKRLIAEQRDYQQRLHAHQTFAALKQWANPLPLPAAEVEAQVKDLTARIASARTEIATLRGEVKVLEAKRVTSSTCGFCGQDVSQFPEVARINAEIAEQGADKERMITAAEGQIDVAKESKEQLEAVLEAQRKLHSLIRTLGGYVEVDESCTPNRLTWKGEVPVEGDQPDYDRPLKECEDKLKACREARARVGAYEGVIAEAEAKILKLRADIAALDLVSDDEFAKLEGAYVLAGDAVRAHESDLARLRDERAALTADHMRQKAEWDRAAETHARLTKEIAETEAAIERLAFNNALVKKIRAARPNVATRMWNLVLASVSTLFSQMRGEKSVVTKSNGGFAVNGHSAGTLSGSTKDILGLAVRVALIKTFLPNCPFIVLDEPAQGCDTDRTGALLGFIATCGFSQVILVTHDSLSESFADNLIEL